MYYGWDVGVERTRLPAGTHAGCAGKFLVVLCCSFPGCDRFVSLPSQREQVERPRWTRVEALQSPFISEQ